MRVVFIGTGEIGLPVLRWLVEAEQHELVGVVTQPDKPAGRSQRLQPPAIKAALPGPSIPILQPRRIKADEAVQEIRKLAPDLVVVMAYGQILPRSVLEIPGIACLNLHASLLPRHRGAAPIQAAIMDGESETGITVMYMDEGLDTGDILSAARLPIGASETGGSLHDRLAEMAPSALAQALAELEAGTAPRISQNSAEASYAPKLKREDGELDWNQSAESLERRIRAFDPWPGSYSLVRDDHGQERKLKIFRGSVVDQPKLPPGAFTALAEDIFIGSREGTLRLDVVQLEGKKLMSGADLLRGHSWLARAAVQ